MCQTPLYVWGRGWGVLRLGIRSHWCPSAQQNTGADLIHILLLPDRGHVLVTPRILSLILVSHAVTRSVLCREEGDLSAVSSRLCVEAPFAAGCSVRGWVGIAWGMEK